MADNSSPKYKSIDDILEALKDHSADEDSKEHATQPLADDAEDHDEAAPASEGHVKTAKQLREELSAHAPEEPDPLDDETSPAEPEPAEDKAEIDHEEEVEAPVKAESTESAEEEVADEETTSDESAAETTPQPSTSVPKQPMTASPGPFKAHISSQESTETHEDVEETPPQHSAVFGDETAEATEPEPTPEQPAQFETKFNVGSHDQTAVEETAAPAPAAYEKSLDDLVTETSQEQDQGIPRLTPKAPANPSMGQPMAAPPPHQMPQSTAFNSRNFDYDLNNQNRGSKFHVLILAIIGLAVIGGSVYFLKTQLKGGSPTAQASPTPAPVETPIPTPTPVAINRGDFKVRVLNGTPTTGLAGKVSTQLKDLGYQAERTGNATNSAFTQTYIRVKPDQTALFDQLKQDLTDYPAASASALKDTDAADAEVILGTND